MRTQHKHEGDRSSYLAHHRERSYSACKSYMCTTRQELVCSCVTRRMRACRPFAVDFDGPNIPRGVELTGNIFDMLGILNLSSLHSNVQHLATTLSGHSPSLVADALYNQPTHLSYSQHEPRLSVSIGTSRSSVPRALQLHGQAYISRGWAASHLQLNSAQAQSAFACDDNLPLLDRVR